MLLSETRPPFVAKTQRDGQTNEAQGSAQSSIKRGEESSGESWYSSLSIKRTYKHEVSGGPQWKAVTIADR